MAKVFISFLGMAPYVPATYHLAGQQLKPTEYVQVAEIEWYGAEFFDRLVILTTNTSHAANWTGTTEGPPKLLDQLLALGVPSERVFEQRISEDLADGEAHWAWLQAVLDRVDRGDELVFDMTHGFRVVPIVISAAIGYLQTLKNVRLLAVHYGTEPKDRKKYGDAQIVDITAFYAVQGWADAVSRLLDNADANKLAQMAASTDNTQFALLNDTELTGALGELTALLRNINVNDIAMAAGRAMAVVEQRRKVAKPGAERQMLDLVADKFAQLACGDPASGLYDERYLQVQLTMANLLLDHGLLMQAYTVLRELVGSIGMVGWQHAHETRTMDSSKGRGARGHGERFVALLTYERAAWREPSEREQELDVVVVPWLDRLADAGLETILRVAVADIVKTRNGFDHAWTSVTAGARPTAESLGSLAAQGRSAANLLRVVVERLREVGSAGVAVG